MERLGHLCLEFDSIREYSADFLCELLVPPRFVPELAQDDGFAVRIVFMPSFDSEFVITLRGDATRVSYSIRSARVSIWHFWGYRASPRLDGEQQLRSMLPLGLWETKGELDAGLLPGCIQSADSFRKEWQPSDYYEIADGMQVDACRVDALGQDEYRLKGGRVWNSDGDGLCTSILTALKTDCTDADAAALIDGALGCYGIERNADATESDRNRRE